MNQNALILIIAEVITIILTLVGAYFINQMPVEINVQSTSGDKNKKTIKMKRPQRQVYQINNVAPKTISEKIAELDVKLKNGEITKEEYTTMKNNIIMGA